MKIHFKKDKNSGLLVPQFGPIFQHQTSLSVDARACGTLSGGNLANCDTKPKAGTETTLWLFNRADLDVSSLTYDTNPMILTGFSLNATKVTYKFKGIKSSNNPSSSMNRGRYINNWVHNLDFLLFDNSGAGKKVLTELADSEVCAIVENKWKGTSGNMAFELYGLGVGLVLTQASRNPSDADTAGAWRLVLGPDQDQFEDTPPLTIFDTDYETTKSFIVGLETA